jgi:hypothetical protein
MLATRTLTAGAYTCFHICIYGAKWQVGVGVYSFGSGLLDYVLAELRTCRRCIYLKLLFHFPSFVLLTSLCHNRLTPFT